MSTPNLQNVAATLSEYQEKIWLKHPNEPDEAYKNFVKYYLPLKAARSVLGAYKSYLKEEKQRTDGQIKRINSVTKAWQYWSKGQDDNGEDIQGLHSWDERAQTYWDYVYSDEINVILERRGTLVETEYEDGVALLKQWNDLYGQFALELEDMAEQSKKLGKRFDPTPHLRKLRDLVKSRDEIATFLRRSVGMMDKVSEDALAAHLAENKEIRVQWIEPEIKHILDTPVDQLSDEDFERLLKNDLKSY